MTLLKTICATMLALAICTGARADDTCKTCEEKPRCAECDKCSVSETAKRAANPVKNFFVHKVSATIVHGFGFNKCETCSTCGTEPKSDCGCGK